MAIYTEEDIDLELKRTALSNKSVLDGIQKEKTKLAAYETSPQAKIDKDFEEFLNSEYSTPAARAKVKKSMTETGIKINGKPYDTLVLATYAMKEMGFAPNEEDFKQIYTSSIGWLGGRIRFKVDGPGRFLRFLNKKYPAK